MNGEFWSAVLVGAIAAYASMFFGVSLLALSIIVWLARRGRRLNTQQGRDRMQQAAQRAATMTNAPAASKEG